MALVFEEGETSCAVRLNGQVTIAQAAELKQHLVRALAHPGAVHVELAGSTQVDFAILQLLWVAEREAQGAGKEFRIGAVPDAMQAALRECGLRLAGAAE